MVPITSHSMKSFKIHKYLLILAIILGFTLENYKAFGQLDEDEAYYTSQLDTVVENLNRVLKPLVNITTGVYSFWGDVHNNLGSPLNGEIGFRIGATTFVGKKKQIYKMNLFASYGSLSGNDFKLTQQMQTYTQDNNISDMNGELIYPTSSFKTEFFQAGVTFEYGFGHWFGIARKFKPFVSAGVSMLYFAPKGNYTYGKATNGVPNYYHHWSDGTIRTLAQNSINASSASIIHFDSKYETNLINVSKDIYDVSYSNSTFAIPVGLGFDFYLTERVCLRVGFDVNYTFSDLLDNYDDKIAKKINASPKNNLNDIFTYTYFSFNFDLFSDAKSILLERMFADLDYDYILQYDEDGDWVMDVFDKCLDTPPGVAVDTSGCPLDTDNDGIPDYMDNEPNTPSGATVDENGVQLNEEALAELYGKQTGAADRTKAIVVPLAKIWTRSITYTPGIIPDKFRIVDADTDGYISFEELLKAIADFFDERNKFTSDDINELNSFFFTQ